MVHQKLFAVGVLGWVMAGCALQAEGTTEGELSDVKPEDGSEFAGSQFGSAQQAHEKHYTDGTNLWQERAYPMGTDNPNCKDWYVYDRYVYARPPVNTWSYFRTYDTNHPWATGDVVNAMLQAIPSALGYDDEHRTFLRDHNSVVARANGRCSGRYVFQVDNRTGLDVYDFGANAYSFQATIPTWERMTQSNHGVMPFNESACRAREPESVPHVMIDLYACEAWDRRSVAGSIGTFCSKERGNWRKVASSTGYGWWNTATRQCDTATAIYYQPPANGKLAVSFNMVVKAGVGHAPAPANIQIYRYN
jgi:hypothetical protein